jgi:kinetochore protein Nuf2
VSNELAELQRKLKVIKEQMTEDEPKCEELKRENAGITAHLMATKEIQVGLVNDIEALKKEKKGVLARKVHFLRSMQHLRVIKL